MASRRDVVGSHDVMTPALNLLSDLSCSSAAKGLKISNENFVAAETSHNMLRYTFCSVYCCWLIDRLTYLWNISVRIHLSQNSGDNTWSKCQSNMCFCAKVTNSCDWSWSNRLQASRISPTNSDQGTKYSWLWLIRFLRLIYVIR